MTVTRLREADELSVRCPTCNAEPQQPCTFDVDYLTRKYHLARVDALHALVQIRSCRSLDRR